jgi:hypothetical protein
MRIEFREEMGWVAPGFPLALAWIEEPEPDLRNADSQERDLLTETLDLIPNSTHGQRLVRFLANRSSKKATRKEISQHLYKSTDKHSLNKSRHIIKRAAESLDDEDAPLRIIGGQRVDDVVLTNADPTERTCERT